MSIFMRLPKRLRKLILGRRRYHVKVRGEWVDGPPMTFSAALNHWRAAKKSKVEIWCCRHWHVVLSSS